jgi:hypothetical protein
MAKRVIASAPGLKPPHARRGLRVAASVARDGSGVWITWDTRSTPDAAWLTEVGGQAVLRGWPNEAVLDLIRHLAEPVSTSDIGLAPLFANLAAPGRSIESRVVDCLTFWRLFGPVVFCEHYLPGGHCGKDPTAGHVPLDVVVQFAALIRDVLLAGTEAQVSPRKGFGREAEARYPALASLVAEYRTGEVRLLRSVVAWVLSWMLDVSGTTPIVAWGQGDSTPALELAGDGGSLSSILWDVLLALSEAKSVAECTGCAALVDGRTRRRSTPPSQQTWCDECRAAGAHKRDSERRIRSNKRGGATRPRERRGSGGVS